MDVEAAAAAATSDPHAAALQYGQREVKHKRRYCREPNCNKIVKSQGLCQRHGARPRKCRVSDCVKQAQGNFDHMCKAHFKAFKKETTPLPKVDADPSQLLLLAANECDSVYERILPQSVSWHRGLNTPNPLVRHLAEGFEANKPPAWHRNEERRSRGLVPVQNAAQQLEGWERELVWMEILALSGNAEASFRHLARAWGRDKGFHMVLTQFICERRGDVERKKRVRQTGAPDMYTVWDTNATGYGDVDVYNEALAADLLTFSQQAQGLERAPSPRPPQRRRKPKEQDDQFEVQPQQSLMLQAQQFPRQERRPSFQQLQERYGEDAVQDDASFSASSIMSATQVDAEHLNDALI